MLSFFNKNKIGTFIVWDEYEKTIYVTKGYISCGTLVFNTKVRKIDFTENLSLYNDYEKGKKIACNVCDDYEEIRDIIPSYDIKSSNKHNLLETFKRAEKRVVILSK